MTDLKIILASTSHYRRSILSKLGLPFDVAKPDCDETPLQNEKPQELVLRLSQSKAESCPCSDENRIIIGSDQVCVIDGQIMGKPHTKEKAIEQLLMASGKSITFYTGVALHNTRTGITDTELDTFVVHFRHLTKQQIANYVEKEQPLDCAGGFKSEGLGIALFERLEGKDPNALIGLPLITLIDMLEKQGITVL
ncbi:septum formation inhibitor Maf [Vibrio albus]|uniref:7-methyl-GTP pyrophosphatase n=1 Tax=Vibrio albus TaxID=2200953 RepID=A0A2U3BDX7_9VIBR|nr:nucleoside triphosphate pyrophosphatase [Vibrio albus]PWI35006.1 septum formation inhibitor Maf [Vibrio albus]